MLSVKPRGAFSLIELLVVVGIVGIVASLLLPAVAAAKDKAKRVVCMHNERQLMQVMEEYVADNAHFPFVQYNTNNQVLTWDDLIKPYHNSKWGSGVTRCPGYKWQSTRAFDHFMGLRGSYAYNGFGGPITTNTDSVVNREMGLGHVSPGLNMETGVIGDWVVKPDEVKTPSAMFAIGDSLLAQLGGIGPVGQGVYRGGPYGDWMIWTISSIEGQ